MKKYKQLLLACGVLALLLTLGMKNIGGARTYELEVSENFIVVMDTRTSQVRVTRLQAKTEQVFGDDERVIDFNPRRGNRR